MSDAYLPGPERRRRILQGAKRVFAARGYHDTNISHICDDLGIARGTLYLYFRSKQDVFAAVVEDMLERLRRHVSELSPLRIPDGYRPTVDEVLRFSSRSLKGLLEAVFEDEASLRIVVREAVGLDVQIDAIVRAIDDNVVDRCAGDMTAAQRAGVLRADVDPRKAALFVMGGIQKLALAELQSGRGKLDLEKLADEATRMELLGLIAGPVQQEVVK
jgi:AcrR family transcriptional regulator